MNLASVVSGLRPGDTLSLVTGSRYTGGGSCGWNINTASGADQGNDAQRPITIRGENSLPLPVIDCDDVRPVVEGIVIGTHLRLENIHFTKGHTSGNRGGGVVRAELGSRVVIQNCRVTNCGTDQEGGAVFISNSTLIISGSHFEENEAGINGGSLAIVDGARATIFSSTFTRCIAGGLGGAVYVRGHTSTLVADAILLSFNHAIARGGALCAYDSSKINMTQTIIVNNTSVYIYIYIDNIYMCIYIYMSVCYGTYVRTYMCIRIYKYTRT